MFSLFYKKNTTKYLKFNNFAKLKYLKNRIIHKAAGPASALFSFEKRAAQLASRIFSNLLKWRAAQTVSSLFSKFKSDLICNA